MTLKTFRRIAVAVIVGGLSIAAAIGIYVVVSARFGSVESQVMATAAAVGGFGVLALCHLALIERPARWFAWGGFAISLAWLVLAIVLIWRPPFDWSGGDRSDADLAAMSDASSAYSDAWEPWWRTFWVLSILVVAAAHAALLLLLIARKQLAVRIAVVATIVLIAAYAVLGILPIVVNGFDGGEWYFRALATVVILCVLGTIVSPVVGLLLRRREAPAAAATPGLGRDALVVIDVQHGFDDPSWGPSTNAPGAERNVARLIAAWQAAGRPIVVVRHDSTKPGSPLAPGQPGNDLKPEAAVAAPALVIAKSVNSAFYGAPALDPWLRANGIGAITVVGIQTNMCVETTARMAGNLGYAVTVPLDATRTFDLETTLPDGSVARFTAEELMRATAVNLAAGGFAKVVSTDAAIAALG